MLAAAVGWGEVALAVVAGDGSVVGVGVGAVVRTGAENARLALEPGEEGRRRSATLSYFTVYAVTLPSESSLRHGPFPFVIFTFLLATNLLPGTICIILLQQHSRRSHKGKNSRQCPQEIVLPLLLGRRIVTHEAESELSPKNAYIESAQYTSVAFITTRPVRGPSITSGMGAGRGGGDAALVVLVP
jgi:hypothetical protein